MEKKNGPSASKKLSIWKPFWLTASFAQSAPARKTMDTILEATQNRGPMLAHHWATWLTLVWENTAINALRNWRCIFLCYFLTEEVVNSCQHNSIVKLRQLQLPKWSHHMIQEQWYDGWEAWRSVLWSYNYFLLATAIHQHLKLVYFSLLFNYSPDVEKAQK